MFRKIEDAFCEHKHGVLINQIKKRAFCVERGGIKTDMESVTCAPFSVFSENIFIVECE
jgi:hypothetical protein